MIILKTYFSVNQIDDLQSSKKSGHGPSRILSSMVSPQNVKKILDFRMGQFILGLRISPWTCVLQSQADSAEERLFIEALETRN